jgi:ubiquinone/menaquinone biosynthesis C-methylase UbiE
MLFRKLEPEVMDSAEEARDYDAMDHAAVNRAFVDDLLAALEHADHTAGSATYQILDLGTGTAQIPIELCRRMPAARVVAIDMAEEMLKLGRRNVASAGLQDRIQLERADGKKLPYVDHAFDAVISNSIVHHISEPRSVVAEALRVVRPCGLIFFRDLLRPSDHANVRRLVEMYAAGANEHQRALFDASLRAALSLDEISSLLASLGRLHDSVQATSDRHWTWSAI